MANTTVSVNVNVNNSNPKPEFSGQIPNFGYLQPFAVEPLMVQSMPLHPLPLGRFFQPLRKSDPEIVNLIDVMEKVVECFSEIDKTDQNVEKSQPKFHLEKPIQKGIYAKTFGVSTTVGATFGKPPKKGEGKIIFSSKTEVLIPEGTQFQIKADFGELVFTLGCLGTEKQQNPKIMVLGGAKYSVKEKIDNGMFKIIPQGCDQEFYFEPGTEVFLPKGTIYYIGKTESSLNSGIFAVLI